MITAHLFAKATDAGVTFGASRFVAALRHLADEIEADRIFAQAAEVSSIASLDDFTTTTVTLKLCEKTTP